jgi:hypothetical protein
MNKYFNSFVFYFILMSSPNFLNVSSCSHPAIFSQKLNIDHFQVVSNLMHINQTLDTVLRSQQFLINQQKQFLSIHIGNLDPLIGEIVL